MAAKQNRRSAIKNIIAGSASVMSAGVLSSFTPSATTKMSSKLKGNINHSVCAWCYKIPLEELCVAAKAIGITAIDLVGPDGWPTLKKHGLHSSMCNGAEINLTDGFNDKKNHAKLFENYSKMIPMVAAEGYKNLICFSGSRRGMDDETGWNNCVEGLKPLVALAEKNNVIIAMELLNSRFDHKDYQCDRTSWGVELVKRINSPNFRLLYDIYHMQIDEGDVIRTIQKNHQYFSHYHTGGVPGRAEIDETQELYYPAIMRAIKATGYTGYVGQEFVPKRDDKIASLKQGVEICDI
ncbi:TIM barrel protein [Mucilaginibacter puniceus]